MDDLKKYAPQIALLKEFFWDFWLMDLTDDQALSIILQSEAMQYENLKNKIFKKD